MSVTWLRRLLLPVIATAVAACGSDADSGAAEERPQSTTTQQPPAGSDPAAGGGGGGEQCQDIPVPGHEATEVRVQGASCAQAADLAAAAVGKGRQAFRAAGFSCEPSDAGGGDTNYACTQADARVTFRYGAT